MVNHARAKRRRKVLKLKMFFRRVIEKRQMKIAKLKKTKGKTITGEARLQAFYPGADYSFFIASKERRLNQRQKRKLWRHAPHMRNKI